MPGAITSALRRGGAAVLGGTLVAGLTVGFTAAGPIPPAHAHESDPVPAQIGATWLESRLTAGVIHNDQFDFDDFGATVEAAYALDAAGRTGQLPAITAALEAGADSYTSPGTEVYSGSTGKLLSFVEDLTTADPTNFGGVDLVAQLEGVTAPSGQIADVSEFGDFANVFGQSYAVRGLTLAESAEAPAALEFLLGLQCEAGYFNLNFAEPCDGPVPPADTTAVVVNLLSGLVIGEDQAALDAALAEAVTWIASQQAADGSFGGGTETEGPNVNSTGLAGQALALGGDHEGAERAATWIRGLQVVDTGCDGALADEQGAIAYDAAAYQAGIDDGITDSTAGQWDFAAIQALPALLLAPASEAGEIDLGRVPDFLDGGGRLRITVTGIAPGERGCAAVGPNKRAFVGDDEGAAAVRVPVQDRTRRLTVSATVLDEAVGTPAVSLSATKLKVAVRDRVAPRGTQRIDVRGLFDAEPLVIKIDGKVVERGSAGDFGRYVALVKVGRDRGRHLVTVQGRFADRKGSASFRIR
jgi:hypothetical protein